VKRGDIWWAELPAPAGNRPVVVLTRDEVVHSIGSVVVCLVTRTVRGLRSEAGLGGPEGLPSESVANLDNLLTVPRQRLVRRMGRIGVEKTRELNAAARFAL
jgi:mRNA interferase MazF